ncbi:MAG TPA: magnesium-translocating P-type ATPase [Bacilli bacterium]|nr:magnesium-translocating P-type ATPase [Bacilli bacterium]
MIETAKKTPGYFDTELFASALASVAELKDKYRLTPDGLNDDQVDESRHNNGTNEIIKKKRNGVFVHLLTSFFNPFTIVLLVLTLVSILTDIVLVPVAERNYFTVIMVLAMVVISGFMKFIQESRSQKAAARLSEMVRTTISVMRSGERKEIPIADVVVGDLVFLAAGDMVPADVRIVQCKDIFVSQSALTGESVPVEKTAEASKDHFSSTLEYRNLAFMGSNVISGSATCIVVSTGEKTMFGYLAKQIRRKKVTTSFDKGINAISWVLIRFMLIMVPIVFLVNGFFKSGPNHWIDAIIFALAVAVGLTPEMLPMIVSSNLGKGAIVMARKKVIVKNLNSIQNFGAADILCTDKTGTLTEDRIVLEYHYNTHGEEDIRVLKHAFLNSYFQTGLKNLMDRAIIDHVAEKHLQETWKDYVKVDEIPFDFARRRMSVIVEDKSGKQQMITKGAIEEMIKACSFAEYNGIIEPLSDELRSILLAKAEDYGLRGLRVLGLAHKNVSTKEHEYTAKDETGMILIGYLAFLDPTKPSAKEAIDTLEEYGVKVKILTGDGDSVTKYVCKQVGINADTILLGSEILNMTDEQLLEASDRIDVFAKLTPDQKTRIVNILRQKHVVGFMGDGINDAAAMKAADVGISVDTAVDIAKESADIIMLEKNLNVLGNGIIEGRKTYANTIKYIKITASSNFGNMLSILLASVFLPFLPMLPLQILILNLIYDISCLGLPFDNVDEDYLKSPRKWEAASITKFMLWIGPVSSIFDITTYVLMFFVVGPMVFGGQFASLDAATQLSFIGMFQAGWFIESQWSQSLIIHSLRTPKVPFIQSRASWVVIGLTGLGIVISTLLPLLVGFGEGQIIMPWIFYVLLAGTLVLYVSFVSIVKKFYLKKYHEWL